jgi:hypothetical protein
MGFSINNGAINSIGRVWVIVEIDGE